MCWGDRLSSCVFVLRTRIGTFSVGGCYQSTDIHVSTQQRILAEYTGEKMLATVRASLAIQGTSGTRNETFGERIRHGSMGGKLWWNRYVKSLLSAWRHVTLVRSDRWNL
jgi:hypothetical protein